MPPTLAGRASAPAASRRSSPARVGLDGDNVLVRGDPTTLEVTKRIPLEGVCSGIATVDDSIWISGRICGSGITKADTVKGAAGRTVDLTGMTGLVGVEPATANGSLIGAHHLDRDRAFVRVHPDHNAIRESGSPDA